MAKLFSNQRLNAVGRLLSDEEAEQVFGGYGIADEGLDQFFGAYGQAADDDDDDDDDIVVTGDPGEDDYDGEDGTGGDEDYGDDDDDSEDGGDGDSAPAVDPDGASRDMTVALSPTTEQQAVIDRLMTALLAIDSLVANIDPNAILNISGFGTVTGIEAKNIWALVDFTINPIGTTYLNGTTRGQADLNGVNPQISFNIYLLSDYDALTGDINFVILHDFAHLLTVSQAHLLAIQADDPTTPGVNESIVTAAEVDARERLANDIARAIANAGVLPVLPTAPTHESAPPEYGYSTDDPLPFVPPPAPSQESSGAGSGGSGGSPNVDQV
jgi:hypothetical protein